MERFSGRSCLARAVTLIALAMPLTADAARGQDMKDSSGNKSYLPPDKYTPSQLKAHIEKLQKTSVKDRKPEVAAPWRPTGFSKAIRPRACARLLPSA
jgi:hypothetical protein